jgi:ABC-type multidrug transport system permease subunit
MTNLSDQYKKRFKIIILFVLPLCLIIGFFTSVKIASLFNYKIDLKSAIFVSLSFVPLYVMSVIVAYRKLQKKSKEKNQID